MMKRDLAEKRGHNRPGEREELIAMPAAIDQEEARTLRLLASGKISEDVWAVLWAMWQDRRFTVTFSILRRKVPRCSWRHFARLLPRSSLNLLLR